MVRLGAEIQLSMVIRTPNQLPNCPSLHGVIRALALVLLFADRGKGQEPDPVPIQRIEISPERLSAEMDRLRRRVLTELPRADFEKLGQRAAHAEAAGKTPPHLLEAHYEAAFSEGGLAGSAEWKIGHDADGPGRLPLGALQLALRSAKWSDQAPVVLGNLDTRPGAGLELLVEGKGERKLSLLWSARGLAEPSATRFELRLPACAATTLDLDLPPDHALQVDREDIVLSGPTPAKKPNQWRWRLSFPRMVSAGLTVRLSVLSPPSPSQPPPLLRTFVQTTQKL